MDTNNPTRAAMQSLMGSTSAPAPLVAGEFADKRGRLARATEALNAAIAAGQITTGQLKDAKDDILRALESAWEGVTGLLLKGSHSQYHNDLYWKSLYRPELHRLNGAIKLADAAKSGNDDEAAAIVKAKAILAAFKPYADAVDYLKGKIVKRVIKSEEEKRAERLVPKTAQSALVLAAVNAVIEQQRPDLVKQYIEIQRKYLAALLKKYGPALEGIKDESDRSRFSAIVRNLVPVERPRSINFSVAETLDRLEERLKSADEEGRIYAATQIKELATYLETQRQFDEARLLASANHYVDGVFDFVRGKMMEKAGQLENPVVKDMSGATFLLTGELNGKKVGIRQSIIINSSVHGKLFNQFPARITVGGKAMSEADYKKEMTNTNSTPEAANDDGPSP